METSRRSQSHSYGMTVGQLASLSWCQAPVWGRRQDFFTVRPLRVCLESPLLWEDGSVVCNCCWPSPAQSFSSPSPTVLMTIFYCLRFETPITWRARSQYLYLPRNRVAQFYPSGTGFPFRSILRLAGLRWRYSNPSLRGLHSLRPLRRTTPRMRVLPGTLFSMLSALFAT
jgi:hypothetical protein